jgi:membrane protein implicated in regulation of membrane protease activity
MREPLLSGITPSEVEGIMSGDILQHWHDAVGVLGLALLAASYLSPDMRRFRLWSVGAFAVGAIYFILVPEGSNWVGVLAMAVYGGLNLILFARARKQAPTQKTAG